MIATMHNDPTNMALSEPLPASVPVFIVGGGPSGLAMSLLLHRFRIRNVVIERSATTTDHPKSRGCWIRTMELFRQWGVEAAIRARGLRDQSDMFVFVESMAGHEFGRTRPEPNLQHTPAWKSLVAQDAVEEVLLDSLRGSPWSTVLYSTEFLSFAEQPDGHVVSARSLETGQTFEMHARYLIAADGAGSPTRRAAGIEMTGPSTIAVMANDYWRADLSHLPKASEAAGFRVVPADRSLPSSTILNTNGRDRWLTVTQIGQDKDDRPEPWDDAELIRIVRAQTGVPDLQVKIINRSIWRVSRQVARQFSAGRIFLVGDAAHRFPPTGGFGLNSSVQDAHNLAWKLAYVLRGWADERLLESYGQERRPVAESNADFSFGNRLRFTHAVEAVRSGDVDRIAFWVNDMDNHLHSVGQALGFTYREGCVIPDGTVPKPLNPRHYEPTDRPGARFPHVWLDAARERSTLDWFDERFVLVTGPRGDDWEEACRSAAQRLDLPIDFRMLETPTEGMEMGPRGAVLVRPDGHVAWRCPWQPPDMVGALTSTLRGLLR
jgi:2-polyprenyl-6-methoxyphenol hydroxylase-like FAD-dependent oxidoreductase